MCLRIPLFNDPFYKKEPELVNLFQKRIQAETQPRRFDHVPVSKKDNVTDIFVAQMTCLTENISFNKKEPELTTIFSKMALTSMTDVAKETYLMDANPPYSKALAIIYTMKQPSRDGALRTLSQKFPDQRLYIANLIEHRQLRDEVICKHIYFMKEDPDITLINKISNLTAREQIMDLKKNGDWGMVFQIIYA